MTTAEVVPPLPDALSPGCPSDQFRSIVENLREVVFQTDLEGRWTYLNPAWEEITGYSIAEALGKVFLDYVHPDDREGNVAKFKPLIERTKNVCRHEVRYLTKDGGFRWIEVHARLILTPDNAIAGTCGTLTNITPRRQAAEDLQEAQRRVELLLASNPAVLFAGRVDNGHHKTGFISENIRTYLGYEPEQFISDPEFYLGLVHPDDRPAFYASFAELEARGRAIVRCRQKHRDGSYRWMRCDTRLIRDSAGHPVQTFGCVVDETKTWEHEQTLKRQAAILEAVSFAAARFLDARAWHGELKTFLERIGRAADVSRVWVSRYRPDHAGTFIADESVWVAEGVAEHDAEPDGLSWEKKGWAEWVEKLRNGEAVVSQTPDVPHPGRVFVLREGIQSLLIVPIFVDKQWWGLIGFDDAASAREWTGAEIGALKTAAGILGSAIGRENAAAALRYKEALLRTITEASPLAFYAVDNRTDQVLYFNERFCEMWGITHLRERIDHKELSNRELFEQCSSMVQDSTVFESICKPLRDENNQSVTEDRIGFEDGRVVRRFSTQIRDAADGYFGRLYAFEDVTLQVKAAEALEKRVEERTAELRQEIVTREHAEKELAHREQQFRALIENTLDVIFVVNAKGIIQFITPSAKRVLQYEPEALVGRSCFSFVHPDDLQRIMNVFRKTTDAPGMQAPAELEVRNRAGGWRRVESVANNQLLNPGVQGVIVTFRDITERKLLEDQFRQAQKLEAIGRLAGGVAHDFNNLLTVIRGYSELLLKRLEPDSTMARNVSQIKRAGDRGASLVQQLLAFSRKQVIEPKVIDINLALADLEKMLRRLIGEDIDLTVTPATAPLFVNIDPTQFEQIVINLSVNARDAMPRGGRLTVSTAIHEPRGLSTCTNCKIAAGNYSVLAVEDTGTGISNDVRAHIFEPFFTTKEVGKGTGLGLSMVYGAVARAGGHICLDSALGKGSTFRICLPIAENHDEAAAPGLVSPGEEFGHETVLLVEDEELVRVMLQESLEQAGFRVLQARHGESALDLAAKYQGPIDLLLTDVIMPRLNGPELASKLAVIRPGIKVLYVSGYPRNELVPTADFLKKPFTPSELVRQVRRILDGA